MNQSPGFRSLWLPLSAPWGAFLSCGVTIVLFLASMARDLSFFDSPLLSMAAVQFGLAHPPGQPLHTLLGGLFAHLSPFGPLVGVNALSAIAGGLTVLPALSFAQGLAERDGRPLSRGAQAVIATAIVFGAQHAVIWEQSTRVEVYALAVFLCMWCLARLAYLLAQPSERALPFLGLGAGLGLAASTNPVFALIAVFAAAPAVLSAVARRTMSLLSVVWVGVGGVLGLAPYAYVPWVAGRTNVLRWGAPTNYEALVHYFSGRDFSSNLTATGGLWVNQVLTWFSWSYETAILPVLALGSVAQFVAPARGLGRFVTLLATVLSVAYLARNVRFNPDVPDHISYVSLAMWLSLSALSGLCGELYERGQRAIAVAIVGVPLACAFLSPPALLTRKRSRDQAARRLATEVLEMAQPNAILFLTSDHWAIPVMYLQEVEHARPDVVLVATGLLSSSWHWDRIYQHHPELAKIAMAGAGGRLGRARRFLEANATRPVLVDGVGLANSLGLSTCLDGWLLLARAACSDARRERVDSLIASWVDDVDDGEPTSLGALSFVSAEIGETAWRAADPTRALRVLLAGVPSSWGVSRAALPDVSRAPALGRALPSWRRDAPLGDPARNAFVAGQLALSAGQLKAGVDWIAIAAQHGLPEASEWLTRMQDVAAH